jgi:hypothetical protein
MRRISVAVAALVLGAASVFAQSQSVQPVAPAKSTASWTSATSLNTALTVVTRNMPFVKVTLHATSTMSVGVLNFEINDGGSTWFASNCRRDGGASITGQSDSTYTLSATDQTWVCYPNGATNFRIRLNPAITGSGTAALGVLPIAFGGGADIVGAYIANGSATATDAATLTAGTANLAQTIAQGFAFDGTTWRRLQSDTNGYLKTIFGSAQTIGLAAGTAYAGKVATWADGTLASGGTAAMTGTTSTQVIAGTASNYIYVSSCSINNTHATVDTLVDLQDGSGGTVLWTFDAPKTYGGESHTFDPPLKVPTSGNGLFAVDETTGASVKIFCQGFKSTTSF